VEEVLLQRPDRLLGSGDGQWLALHLAAVVGQGGEIADVVEVGVAHEHRLEPRLIFHLETARERAGVDGEQVVEDERAGAVPPRFAPVAADYTELHAQLSPPNFCGISRNSRKSWRRPTSATTMDPGSSVARRNRLRRVITSFATLTSTPTSRAMSSALVRI